MTHPAGVAWAAATSLAGPFLRLMLARRAARGKEIYARLDERRGIDPTARPEGRVLWMHAASVGEAVSALPLLCALPGSVKTVFTTGTVTSANLLATRLPELGLQDRVLHRFVPLDVPAWGARFLDHWRPDAAGFLESELWPNLLAACRARKIPTGLINARLSARSAANWGRLPGFAKTVLYGFDLIAAQSEDDAARLRALGAEHIEMLGNLKFAAPVLPVDEREQSRLRILLGDRPRWLAASTHPGDEEIAAAVHARLAPDIPGLLTAIVPRHPERGGAIAVSLGQAPRRALGEDPPPGGLWVADTLGELGLLYRLFPTVFLGKSFAPHGGGQNPLEPARLGCALATGPNTANFLEPVRLLSAAGGLSVVGDEDALGGWVLSMLRDAGARQAAGQAAASVATQAGDLPGILAARLVELMR